MTSVDIELGLSDEDRAVRDLAHDFALEVLRPAGVRVLSASMRDGNFLVPR
jgi:hypothetical protein